MLKKARLLIVTDEMEVGGTQRQIVNLLSNIDRSKFDVQLVYFINDSYLIDELKHSGVIVTQVRKTRSLDIMFIYNFVKFLRSNKFDIVHSFSMSAEFWTMIALLFVKDTKFFSSIRGVYEWYAPGHWFAKSLISKRSAAIISNSESGKQYAAQKQWFPCVGIDVVHNGIKSPGFYKSYDTKQTGELKCLVLGRLIEGKNIRLLIDAVRRINGPDVRIQVEIAGSGPDKESLQEYASDLEVGTIVFLGEVDDVSDLFVRNDVLVQPSLREGLSNSILEAMFSGLPVIASDADGNVELITDSKTGFLFKNDQLESLIEKLLFVHVNYDQAVQCAETVKTWVDTEFSITTMCTKFENKYLEVLNEY